jgi:uncharacterized repeat protein (TIGR03803 family)
MDGAGNLYGITDAGGANTLGTLFKMDSTNHVTVLYNFGASATDAVRPVGDLLMDAAGNLYGATVIGGTANLGTVFKLDTTGHLTVLHSFTGTAADGNDPLGGLIMDAAGNLYGATLLGGASNLGTVYKLTTPPPVNNFTSFTAQVVVSRLLHSTAVAGEFSSASSIDPTSQAVTLSVAGTNSFSWTFAPGSFKKLFGVYVASSANVSMLLVPLKNGNWSYSASVVGFVPGSTSVTVTLTIPPQSGSATVNATVF